MSLANGNGASYTGLWRTVLAGLILAAALGAWNVTTQLASINASLLAIQGSIEGLDERVKWLERRERRQ